MHELFCPVHGIPAWIGYLTGGDMNLLFLTFQMARVKVTSWLKPLEGLWQHSR